MLTVHLLVNGFANTTLTHVDRVDSIYLGNGYYVNPAYRTAEMGGSLRSNRSQRSQPSQHSFNYDRNPPGSVTQLVLQQGPISQTDLSLATYHFVLDLSPKTDLSLFVKSAPGHFSGCYIEFRAIRH